VRTSGREGNRSGCAVVLPRPPRSGRQFDVGPLDFRNDFRRASVEDFKHRRMAIGCRQDAVHFVERSLVVGDHESSHRSGDGGDNKASSTYGG